MDYSKIRGFNIHGDWGSNGLTQWINFDKDRYKKMVHTAKQKFPGMNTVRIWLSFDAWVFDKAKYLDNIKTAGEILTEAGLNIIPVYYNGWFGLPEYGGLTRENVQEYQWPAYIRCTEDTTRALSECNILMFDVSNEPFNSVQGDQNAFEIVFRFLSKMAETIRKIDSRPITVSTQGYPNPDKREGCDIDRLMTLVDVLGLHPYNIEGLPQAEFEKQFQSILDYAKPFNKPIIITESMWGAPTAEERKKYLETEFETYSKMGMGFLCHALFTCPVADLYPVEKLGLSDGLYMAFLDEDLNIRPYHDIFNRYA